MPALSGDGNARDYAFRLARLALTTCVIMNEPTHQKRQWLRLFPKASVYVVNPAFRVIAAHDIATGLIAPAHHESQVI